MPNPTQFQWVDPTLNEDGSPVTPGEITGYQIGIRPAAGTPGTYPTSVLIKDPTATSEAFTVA